MLYYNLDISQAMTQERRRYGFVLERQCSLAKHYASFHEVALAALHPSVDEWREIAATREYLPQSVEDMFASRLRVSYGRGSAAELMMGGYTGKG